MSLGSYIPNIDLSIIVFSDSNYLLQEYLRCASQIDSPLTQDGEISPYPYPPTPPVSLQSIHFWQEQNIASFGHMLCKIRHYFYAESWEAVTG